VSGYRHLRTERLVLDAVTFEDLEPMFALHSDPHVWAHLPQGRHLDREETARFLDKREREWSADGLGYWVARAERNLADGALPAAACVGIGGCARRFDTVWNIYYRLTPAAWGQGLASEIVAAARAAAVNIDPCLPVVAYLLEHNHGSRRTAERAGLNLVWRGPDHGNPDPAALRLIYSDRPLDSHLIAELTTSK